MNSFVNIRTLFFLAGAGSLVMFLLMGYIQVSRRTYDGFLYWVAASFFAMAGSVLITLRDYIPAFWSIIAANTILSISFVCITFGMMLFSGVQDKKSLLLLIPAGVNVSAMIYFTYVVPDTGARVISVSILVIYYMLVNLYVVSRLAPALLGFTNKPLLLVFGMTAMFSMFRIAGVLSERPGIDDFMQYPSFSNFSTILVAMSTLGVYIGLILLNFQRVEYDLVKSNEEIRTLRGLLPICSHCKKIRDDKGEWRQLEEYISDHSEATFSHGICAECAKENYPEVYDTKNLAY